MRGEMASIHYRAGITSTQKRRLKSSTTFSIGPKPSRLVASFFHAGRGGANLTAPALSTPSGTVISTASACSPSPPPRVCTRTPS